jgi:hypothetical protein
MPELITIFANNRVCCTKERRASQGSKERNRIILSVLFWAEAGRCLPSAAVWRSSHNVVCCLGSIMATRSPHVQHAGGMPTHVDGGWICGLHK